MQQRRNKEHLYAGDDLGQKLAALGLHIKMIEADGNCFYRSVLDQLQGEGGDHLRLRGQVMDFMEEQEEEYRFFIEDDEPFDKYVKRMPKEGAWARHVELQVTALLLQCNIDVYQSGQPVWHITCGDKDAAVLHVSYHDGMHYNSGPSAVDYGSGPPKLLCLVDSGSAAAAGDPAAVAAAHSFGAQEVEHVVAGTGCTNRGCIARVLEQCGGSLDQAIELLIEQLGQEEEAEAAEQLAEELESAARSAGEQKQQRAEAAGVQELPSQQQAGAAGQAERQQEADGIIAGSSNTDPMGQWAEPEQQPPQPADASIRLEFWPHLGRPRRLLLSTPSAARRAGRPERTAPAASAA